MRLIIYLLKILIVLCYAEFAVKTIRNYLKERSLRFPLNLLPIIEIFTLLALAIVAVFAKSEGSELFVFTLAAVVLPLVYFEARRIILVGDKQLQLRLEAVDIRAIKAIKTQYWSLYVILKNGKVYKIINPLLDSYRFKTKVSDRIYPRRGPK